LIARLATILLVAVCIVAGAPAARAESNVLFIIIDDLRPELPVYGNDLVKAPSIGALAESGVVFTNAYANMPVCGASRASLMSGLRPTPTRFVDYDARIDEDAPDVVPLHSYLKSQGYITESIGKVIHHARDSKDGWSRKPWSPAGKVPKEKYTGHANYVLQENIDSFKEEGSGPAFERAQVKDNAYFDGLVTQRAKVSLRRLSESEKPFFLAVGFVKPHLPFNAPKKYWDMYDRADIELATPATMPPGIPGAANHNWGELRKYSNIPDAPEPVPDELAIELRHGYYASTSYADAQVGKVLAELDDLGLQDDTIVILIGDHGWSLGEHGLWAKHSPFDVATRSPAIVRAPGLSQPGVAPGLMEFVDIYPTVIDLLGLPEPEHLQGSSFRAQLEEPDSEGKAVVFPRWKNGEVTKTRDFSMTSWFNDAGDVTARMLFDHNTDRPETKNLVNDPRYENIVEQLDRITQELMQIR